MCRLTGNWSVMHWMAADWQNTWVSLSNLKQPTSASAQMLSLRCQNRISAVILFSDACCYHTIKTLQSKRFVSSCRCGTQLDTRQHFGEESRVHTSWNHEHLFSSKEIIPLHWAMLFWPCRTKGAIWDIRCINYTTCMWVQETCHHAPMPDTWQGVPHKRWVFYRLNPKRCTFPVY